MSVVLSAHVDDVLACPAHRTVWRFAISSVWGMTCTSRSQAVGRLTAALLLESVTGCLVARPEQRARRDCSESSEFITMTMSHIE